MLTKHCFCFYKHYKALSKTAISLTVWSKAYRGLLLLSIGFKELWNCFSCQLQILCSNIFSVVNLLAETLNFMFFCFVYEMLMKYDLRFKCRNAHCFSLGQKYLLGLLKTNIHISGRWHFVWLTNKCKFSLD